MQDKLRDTSTEALRDLGDLGAAIASMSAGLAAGRADPKNVEHLEDLARRHRDSADDRARRRMDSRFHVAVSIAAQSSRLTSAALQLEAELMTLWWGHSGQAGTDGKSWKNTPQSLTPSGRGTLTRPPAPQSSTAETRSNT
ncbi:FCD domain-containing protein [Arthrobacter globiformis]|uniref:FCD domain-containing protein n=1 Tax=Arthrobacter globiformis TaxID=1665 RepID=UPI0027D7BD35|nr:FCD domain-containing protein [Arthrobacter globiformis]